MARRRVVVALALGLLSLHPLLARAQGPTARPRVLIGLIPELNIFKQKARFRPLGEYLTRKVGVPVEFTILSRYGNIIESFQTERMDGAFFGSFTGALAIQKLGVIPLVRPVNLDGSSTYHGHIFVRADSGIRTVAQLRGKRMAFVDRATTAGYVFPLAVLRKAGIPSPDGFFGEYYFTGSHDAAIAAVLDGKADVGAAKNSVYDRMRKEDPSIDRELHVIAESPPVPSNGLCVRKDLDLVLQASLKKALLDLEKDPEGASVLAQFGGQRFIETTAADYLPVIDLAREAGIDLKKYDYRNQ
jgi:phosphonate transport system substrate-binding protein